MIRLALAALSGALLLSGCVYSTPFIAPLPPARFDRDVPMVVKRMSRQAVHQYCRRNIATTGIIRGCAQVYKRRCVIIIPNDEPIGGSIWRHERGHCAGWRH